MLADPHIEVLPCYPLSLDNCMTPAPSPVLQLLHLYLSCPRLRTSCGAAQPTIYITHSTPNITSTWKKPSSNLTQLGPDPSPKGPCLFQPSFTQFTSLLRISSANFSFTQTGKLLPSLPSRHLLRLKTVSFPFPFDTTSRLQRACRAPVGFETRPPPHAVRCLCNSFPDPRSLIRNSI